MQAHRVYNHRQMFNGAVLHSSIYNCVTKKIWSTNEKETVNHKSELMPHAVVEIVKLPKTM